MKFSKELLITCLLAWQVSACTDHDHKQDHAKDHEEHHHEKAHDDHVKEDHKEHAHEEHKQAEESHDGHEEHGSHEHGAAQLTVAVAEGKLEIELETPAANVFGFEHKATSAEDKKTLNDGKGKLEQAATLFKINQAAGCELVKAEVDSALFEDQNDHGHDEHKDEQHEVTHNDVAAHWSFSCKNSEEIHDVGVTLFSAFPKGFEQIKVDWITPTKASTATLKQDGMINLK